MVILKRVIFVSQVGNNLNSKINTFFENFTSVLLQVGSIWRVKVEDVFLTLATVFPAVVYIGIVKKALKLPANARKLLLSFGY